MKKILSIILAMAMMLSMGVMSFAASVGDFYVLDEDGDLDKYTSSTLVPGTNYYIYLGEHDSDHAPTKLKIDADSHDIATDKRVSVLSSENLSVTKKKLPGASTYSYFAILKLKEISASVYQDKEIELVINDTTLSSKDGSLAENLVSAIEGSYWIEYDETYDITDKLTIVSLNDDTEDYDVEDTDAVVTVDSEGVKTDMLISCDTSYDVRFGEKYMDANLDFYYFNNAKARRPMTLTIPKGGFNYIYEKTSNGLVDVTKTEGKNFVVKSISLGDYVLSDIALPANGAANPVVPPVTPAVPGTQGPTGGNIPYNPGTGAAI